MEDYGNYDYGENDIEERTTETLRSQGYIPNSDVKKKKEKEKKGEKRKESSLGVDDKIKNLEEEINNLKKRKNDSEYQEINAALKKWQSSIVADKCVGGVRFKITIFPHADASFVNTAIEKVQQLKVSVNLVDENGFWNWATYISCPSYASPLEIKCSEPESAFPFIEDMAMFIANGMKFTVTNVGAYNTATSLKTLATSQLRGLDISEDTFTIYYDNVALREETKEAIYYKKRYKIDQKEFDYEMEESIKKRESMFNKNFEELKEAKIANLLREVSSKLAEVKDIISKRYKLNDNK
jgi:hypothetical protein